MKEVTTIQISKVTHQEIKKYADDHGYKLKGLVEALIREFLKNPHPVVITKGGGMKVVKPGRVET